MEDQLRRNRIRATRRNVGRVDAGDERIEADTRADDRTEVEERIGPCRALVDIARGTGKNVEAPAIELGERELDRLHVGADLRFDVVETLPGTDAQRTRDGAGPYPG